MRSSSKLLAVMLFSFVALFVISQARTFPTVGELARSIEQEETTQNLLRL
ncbi:hypothetical protein Bca4012_033088 [Brassica carinata]|uniref:Uncharacterized protein n=1 Tax=Brassica carinata TaxID=52824 RepID=A0A8X7RJ31_BRACI|nr:hypothetical protein Bca52824_045963 [Brassica carinata]